MHWKTPDGYQHDSQLTLTDSSGKLTGEISSRRGKVKLTDGSEVLGVLGEPILCAGQKEITSFGGWRAYTASK